MNILIQGVGGIGGITAARLIEAGHHVTLVTGNPSIARAIDEQGIRIEGIDGKSTVRPGSPARVEVPDGPRDKELILLITPSTALETALEASKHRLAEDGMVFCFQNGLPEERAIPIVGREHVAGTVVGWGGSMIEPGVYRRTSRGRFEVGVLDPVLKPSLRKYLEVLEAVAPVRVTDNLIGVRWSKLAINSAITTLGAIGGDRLGALLRYRFVRRLALEIFAEVVAVARAQGITLEKVSGTLDLERIALSDAERRLRLGSPSLVFKHGILLAVGMKYRRLRSSMLYALERGRPIEIDYLNGEVLRHASRLGMDVPVNRKAVQTVKAIEAGRLRPGLDLLKALVPDHIPRERGEMVGRPPP